jgi:hypothetical protein
MRVPALHWTLHMSRRIEGAVELYLRGQVRSKGGDTRKFVSPGHRGVTDQLVLWPRGIMHFVETKSKDGSVKLHQEREHDRMIALGFEVFVLSTKRAVDLYIARKRHLWTSHLR